MCHKDIAEILEKLERNSELAIHWFEDNYINTGKCHLLIFGHKYEYQQAQIGKHIFWDENKVKFLGVTIDNELIFDTNILNISSKAKKTKSFM